MAYPPITALWLKLIVVRNLPIRIACLFVAHCYRSSQLLRGRLISQSFYNHIFSNSAAPSNRDCFIQLIWIFSSTSSLILFTGFHTPDISSLKWHGALPVGFVDSVGPGSMKSYQHWITTRMNRWNGLVIDNSNQLGMRLGWSFHPIKGGLLINP